jgi:hypothetical protein
MTTLEIILITILWVIYGVFSAYQDEYHLRTNFDKYFFHIIFSPLVLIYRILIGLFHPKTIN